MRRNLIISGGIYHPFAETSAALLKIFAEVGVESQVTEDVDAGIADLADGDYSMVTINALRWGMMTADKYKPFRAEWAYQTPQLTRDTLTRFVESGGALFGLHTASICFDDWPEWGALLGAQWQWGTSHHPPIGPVSVRPTSSRHVISNDVGEFELDDEIYHGLELEPDLIPLLEGECGGGDGPQPVVWAREFGKGRVFYDALGHDAASVGHPQHRQLLQQAAQWLLGDEGK